MGLLNRRDRRLLIVAVAIQMGTALLDLLGVLLIGLVGALAVATVQSQPPPELVGRLADIFGLGDLSSQSLIMVIGGAAAVVLLTKSFLSSFLTRRVLIFLANRQALISARLSKELLSQPLTFIQRRSSQETAYALIGGAGAATSYILGQAVIAATELAVLVVLGGALLVVSPWIALGAIAFFAVVAALLQRLMGSWASRIGGVTATADIQSLNAIQEALGAYREMTVSNRRGLVVLKIQDLRWRAAKVAADLQIVGMLPKYVFEAALVVAGFGLASVLFTTQDSTVAVGTLALFVAAGSRVIPSVLRLQSAALTMRSAAGAAGPTFRLAEELGHPLADPEAVTPDRLARIGGGREYSNFVPSVKLESVCLTYPGATVPALRNVSLQFRPGQKIAIVGRSGAGKSSLADVILGALEPDSGVVQIGGQAPQDAIAEWPGGIGYVPQDVMLANDTVRSNVALGLPSTAIDDEMVWDALSRAHAAPFVRDLNDGLETLVGERGARLSGGQRQRLGIARALYCRPRLLVLDEATSALDAETEESISETIDELGKAVTTIIIAHRLSTVRNADVVVYMEDGCVLTSGTFGEVTSRIPSFAEQARLMGLS